MFLTYDRSSERPPANPAAPPIEEASPPRASAALMALLQARQEETPLHAFIPPGIPPGSMDAEAGPPMPLAGLMPTRSWEQNEFRAPELWQLPGTSIFEDETPRRFSIGLLPHGGRDDGAPPAPPHIASIPADEPPPDRRALIASLLWRPQVEEWFLSPRTSAPVVVDEQQVRVPVWLMQRTAAEDQVLLVGAIAPGAYYTRIQIQPSFVVDVDFAKTFSCTVSLAPGS